MLLTVSFLCEGSPQSYPCCARGQEPRSSLTFILPGFPEAGDEAGPAGLESLAVHGQAGGAHLGWRRGMEQGEERGMNHRERNPHSPAASGERLPSLPIQQGLLGLMWGCWHSRAHSLATRPFPAMGKARWPQQSWMLQLEAAPHTPWFPEQPLGPVHPPAPQTPPR